MFRSILILVFLALSASTLEAQIVPGRCIEFVTDAHGTLVALADTCRQDTIKVGGSSAGGPWVFRAEGGASIAIHPATDVIQPRQVFLPADTIIFEGDTAIVPADTLTVYVLVRGPDTLVFTYTGTASAGRTYLRDARAAAHAGLGTIDSTGALYTLDWNFGTLNYAGYTNFSNNGAGGSDSTQFQFNGIAFGGFLVPTDVAYPVTFERGIIKTGYSGILSSSYSFTFPPNVSASPDSTIYSVHIKTEYSGGVRYYYLRVYKLPRDLAGVSVPVNAGTLVASIPLASDRFPTYGTSVQLRLELWIRRL